MNYQHLLLNAIYEYKYLILHDTWN